MLGTETGEQAVVMFLILGLQHTEVAGEAVTKIVQTRCGFAGFGFGTSGMETVGLVSGNLRGSRHEEESSFENGRENEKRRAR